MISSSCDSMVRKIVHGISHKKDIMVYGVDAKLMEDGNRLAKVGTSKISSKVMKISNLPLFESVFKQES